MNDKNDNQNGEEEEGVLTRADMQPVGQFVGDVETPDSEEGVLSRPEMLETGGVPQDELPPPTEGESDEGVLSRGDMAAATDYQYPPEGERQLQPGENINEVAAEASAQAAPKSASKKSSSKK